MKNKILALAIASLFMVSVGAAQFDLPGPELQEYQEPDISVNQEQNTVTATFYLENTAGGFDNTEEDFWIVEISPRKQSNLNFLSLLSTTGISEPRTCDDTRPENVHKGIVIPPSDQQSFSITSPLNGEGTLEPGNYNLVAISTTGCSTGDTAVENPQPVNPYGWGEEIASFTVEDDDSVDTNPGDPSNNVWISYSNSNECLEVSEDSAPTGMTTYDSEQSCLDEQGEDNRGFTLTELVIGVSLSIAAVLITLFGLRRLDIIG